MSRSNEVSRVFDSIGHGEKITVNGLAGRLDTDPRLARMVLLGAQSRGLVEPDEAYVTWVRTATA
jgi:hypothetical protein